MVGNPETELGLAANFPVARDSHTNAPAGRLFCGCAWFSLLAVGNGGRPWSIPASFYFARAIRPPEPKYAVGRSGAP